MDRGNDETMESEYRKRMAAEQQRWSAAEHAMREAGVAADGLMSRIADIRKREAAEAAELLADAITRRMPVASVEQQPPPQPAPSAAAPVNERPRKLLTDWYEITAALEMKYEDRDDIKRMNETFKGPIISKGQGTSPKVYCDDLIHWWNQLAIQEGDLANQREGASLSAEAQYNYSRHGIAAPEIGGEVKKRRSDRKPA